MTNSEKNIKNIAFILGIIIVIIIIFSIISGISLFLNFSSKSNNDNILEKDLNIQEIGKLHIDLESTNIEIIKSNEFKIEKFDIKDSVQFEVVENTLRIIERSKYFWNSSLGGTIVIYLPADLIVNKMYINMGAGKVKIESIDIIDLEIEQGAGNIYMDDCTSEKVFIDGGAGNITIKNSSLENLELNSGVGSVDFSGELLGRSEIDAGVGNIKLALDGSKEFYDFDIEKGLGAVIVDNEKVTGGFGAGPNLISISGGIGNIDIKFR